MNLPTRAAAAAALGRSPDYLKRLRDSHGGFLVHGTHYWLGHSSNAPITWDIDAVPQEEVLRDRHRLEP